MGCVSSKATRENDDRESQGPKRKASDRLVSSSRREEIEVANAGFRNDGSRVRLISKPHENVATSLIPLAIDGEKKVSPSVETIRLGVVHRRGEIVEARANMGEPNSVVVGTTSMGHNMVISHVPNGFRLEHTAAGWPSWLTAVAGEAVKGWLPRRADTFEKLNKIGQGTYSTVYKARDFETGKIVALKKVRFANVDPESVRFMAREIHILRRLDHPNVVKLEALVTSKMSSNLYLVFEYMEHDLAGLVATPGIKFTEPQVKCYMQQLLYGLEHCHSHCVLHRDIKGANLLIDNNGILKIADFGLATIYNPDHKQHLTSRVVTLWYRPPELLLGATEYGVAVDMWSAGCILAELLSGRPIMPGRTEVEQLHKIFKLCGSPSEEYWRTSKLPHATSFKPQQPYPRRVRETFKDFASVALDLLDHLLSVDPADRGTAAYALKSEFFSTKPFPCDPSSLPKYPPCKEYDAKLRNEEARRQREAAMEVHGIVQGSTKQMPISHGNMEPQTRKINGSVKTSSDKYKPTKEALQGLAMDLPTRNVEKGFPYGGPLKYSGRLSTTGLPIGTEMDTHISYRPQGKAGDFPTASGPVVARSNTERLDRKRSNKHTHLPVNQISSKHNHLDVSDSSSQQEWTRHLLNGPSYSQKKEDELQYKESTTGHGNKKNQDHYSGPLMPPGGNFEEILREHERQIQQAVRRARHDRVKPKNYGQGPHFGSLLYSGRNSRPDH
ncbi:probable serine/threonine-protein kinase At1g54610 [Zingiber officinale]|uniref:probable serine/threonine-protein kinase At1g54610 n=1 Tax=Zingiber officinale TaxID=94328 RepID=UPI001C4BF22A|nr:probable serine/threonine-protein kinase At1g54610 [Zingiber officinale]